MEHEGMPTLGSMTLGANRIAVSPVEVFTLTDIRHRPFHIELVQVTQQRQSRHPAVQKPRIRLSELIPSKDA